MSELQPGETELHRELTMVPDTFSCPVVIAVLVTGLVASCTKVPVHDPITMAKLAADGNGRHLVFAICKEMVDRPIETDKQLAEIAKAPQLVQSVDIPFGVYSEMRIQVCTNLKRWQNPESGPNIKGVVRVECIDKEARVKDTFVFDRNGRLLSGNPKIEDDCNGTVEFTVKARPAANGGTDNAGHK
jgi:hypothetical protein